MFFYLEGSNRNMDWISCTLMRIGLRLNLHEPQAYQSHLKSESQNNIKSKDQSKKEYSK